MAEKDDLQWADKKYHCLDCGNNWSEKQITVYTSNNSTKYICNDCRGRCVVDEQLQIKGVKSLKQNYKKNNKITLIILLIILGTISYGVYTRQAITNDYKDYLQNTASLRKIIDAQLESFREDIKLVQDSDSNPAIGSDEIKNAQYRLAKARKYIYSKSFEVGRIEAPKTNEVIELYKLEKAFWLDPTYNNYLTYMGTFNKLKNKYETDYIAVIKETFRKRFEESARKRVKEKLKQEELEKQKKDDAAAKAAK